MSSTLSYGVADPQGSATPLIQVRGVSKRYGAVQALNQVNFDLRAGEVHALVGANGAGKSTLVRILAGVERPDQGELLIDGTAVQLNHATDAGQFGMSFIHQELNLVPGFTVLQNVAMGLPIPFTFINWREVRTRAEVVLDELGAQLPLGALVDDLSVSDRWTVSLVRGLMRPMRMIAMDEPTASFTEQEADRLFALIDTLKARGTAILYISHRLEEVLDLSDRITVFADGQNVAEHARGDLDVRGLARAIAGMDVDGPSRSTETIEVGPVIFNAENVRREPRVKDVSLQVHSGEVLGVAGLVGSGRTEFVRIVAGADRADSGTMTLGTMPFAPKSPGRAIARGVGFVPEERRSEALILDQSVEFNINLSAPDQAHVHPMLPLLSPRAATRFAQSMVQRFRIKTGSVKQSVRELSGGNQQKVVISRVVATDPKLFILDEPTVGVDVGARQEIYGIIRDLANAGAGVIVVSSDFDELQICDRVVVFRDGRSVASVSGAEASKAALTHLCFEDAPVGDINAVSEKKG
ncbi:MAG: sugar ABC transporter ATP-binding protein [Microbacteriaceae bacterium]